MKISNLFSVKNKNILVTGCSSGIGLSLAKGLLENNAKVIGLSKSRPIIISQLDDFFVCDLSSDNDLRKTTRLIKKKFKKIDVLINVAGVSKEADDDTENLKNFDYTFKINIRAIYFLISELKELFVSGGSIINFSSIGGVLGFPNNPYYGASKGGLISLTKAIANDLGNKNIRVNSILPGYFKTKMTENSFINHEKRVERENRTILGRWGTPEELLGATIFLASDASSYVTGSEITVDGGWTNKGL